MYSLNALETGDLLNLYLRTYIQAVQPFIVIHLKLIYLQGLYKGRLSMNIRFEFAVTAFHQLRSTLSTKAMDVMKYKCRRENERTYVFTGGACWSTATFGDGSSRLTASSRLSVPLFVSLCWSRPRRTLQNVWHGCFTRVARHVLLVYVAPKKHRGLLRNATVFLF